ncbi:metallophosphoesterase [Roseomonas sp. NAR14]|uniref:Metallophosphoesterase n=1 Tax=Roseomonas acroporae TaxID=2937791 RepID=A0A9X2BX32_9PROT|nr:metallophosphoesterase [Roseomonas acroporae]MCK8784560.1 metallophosphoesterase [Roseomonas acroporae]
MDGNATGRRAALGCMAWAGAGLLWRVQGGVPRATLLGSAEAAGAGGGLAFVQVSDSHLGFANPPNPDPAGTYREAMALVRAGRGDAALMLHTGDVSHLSREPEFDVAWQIAGEAGLETHYVPGEHDVLVEEGRGFFARFTPRSALGAEPGRARGWYAFDQGGVHFVGLNNVQDLRPGGMGRLGAEQLAWLRDDLAGRAASQPVVVFAHVPLWTVHAPWGWGTDDAAEALALLRRFGSVTVLNGHIHQVMQKVEGQCAFHTARSTAFPQPAPGAAASPGPVRDVPPGRLRALLGITRVAEVRGESPLAVIDTPLGA